MNHFCLMDVDKGEIFAIVEIDLIFFEVIKLHEILAGKLSNHKL